MNLLITNDDGWGAPGIEALAQVAEEYGNVVVVAPSDAKSGISHQMTFEQYMDIEEKSAGSFALDGTPADCVRIGLTQLGKEFDWVLSGINNGSNLGSDVFVSGTVAGAREAAIMGVKSMALSQYRRYFGQSFDWNATKIVAKQILDSLLREDLQPRSFINVNFPDLTDQSDEFPNIVECPVDMRPLPVEYKQSERGFIYCGSYRGRARTPDEDVDLCFNGAITVSRLQL